ncbi:MAG TPA: hypothetical protein VHL09_06455 [Dehalococcoidia bacterium]|nr:hypothetical protein [Dehalococcoidia bacterium]
MTLMRGGTGSDAGGARLCEGCAQPLEEGSAMILYGEKGYRWLHSACWQPSRLTSNAAPSIRPATA